MYYYPFYFAAPQYKDYQQRVINRVNDPQGPHGIIAYHSMGSGKTLTSLGAMDQALAANPGKRGLFVVPASLVDNVYKEMDKHGFAGMKKRVDVLSYEKAVRQAAELAKRGYAMTVFDEAHRMRNSNTARVQKMKDVAANSGKVLMLTGTAGYNHPSDVAALVNIINPAEKLPNNPNDFERAYINRDTWGYKSSAGKLVPVFDRYIDKYDRPTADADYPTVTRKVVSVLMSPEQEDLYRAVENKDVPWILRHKMRKNLPMGLQDAKMLNMYSTGVRQVSDSMVHHNVNADYASSPKIMRAAKDMADAARGMKGFRGLMYSNFIDAGINPYMQALRAQGLNPIAFTGALSKKQKKAVVDAFNAPGDDPRILAVSSSGAEGLDLKNVRVMQILEPHFNTAKLDQVSARAIRYKSHDSLPPDQRNVRVLEYHSIRPNTLLNQVIGQPAPVAIDPYLSRLAARKETMIKNMGQFMRNKGLMV